MLDINKKPFETEEKAGVCFACDPRKGPPKQMWTITKKKNLDSFTRSAATAIMHIFDWKRN